MKMIYCEDCKFYIDLYPSKFMGIDEFCINDNTPKWENPRLNYNLGFDCSYYKRKWWKFWVKN